MTREFARILKETTSNIVVRVRRKSGDDARVRTRVHARVIEHEKDHAITKDDNKLVVIIKHSRNVILNL